MFFSPCLALLLGLLGPQAPENLGTKIVTRQTVGSGFTEQTLYITADRSRMEFQAVYSRRTCPSLLGHFSDPMKSVPPSALAGWASLPRPRCPVGNRITGQVRNTGE